MSDGLVVAVAVGVVVILILVGIVVAQAFLLAVILVTLAELFSYHIDFWQAFWAMIKIVVCVLLLMLLTGGISGIAKLVAGED